MRILLINVPHPSIGSRIPDDHLPPLGLRHAMRWYTQMGRRVWPHEILGFLRDRRLKHGPTVEQFWGAPQDSEEESMSSVRPERRVGVRNAA